MACPGNSPFAHLINSVIVLNNNEEIQVTEIYDYEPSDRSVGIYTGFLCVLCDDGCEYDILDNGWVQRSDDQKCRTVGHTSPLHDSFY